jgi:hypothetical protein
MNLFVEEMVIGISKKKANRTHAHHRILSFLEISIITNSDLQAEIQFHSRSRVQ